MGRLVCLMFIVISNILSQTNNSPIYLKEVKAIHSNDPSITIINKKQILNLGASNIAEALKNIPSIQVTQFNNSSQISFKSGNSSQTIILINGRPLKQLSNSILETSLINVENIKRIEVYQYSNYLFISHNAIGGIINIITDFDPYPLSYSLSATTYKDFKLFLSTTIPYKKHSFNVALSGIESSGQYQYKSPYDKLTKKINILNHGTTSMIGYTYQFDNPYLKKMNISFAYNSLEKNHPGSDQYPTKQAQSNHHLFETNLNMAVFPLKNHSLYKINFNYNHSYQTKEYKNKDDIYDQYNFYKYNKHSLTIDSQFKFPFLIFNTYSFYSHGNFTSNLFDFDQQKDNKKNQIFNNSIAFNFLIKYFNILNSYSINTFDFNKVHFKTFIGLMFSYKNTFTLQADYQRQLRHPSYEELFLKETGLVVRNPNLKNETSHIYTISSKINILSYVILNNSFYFKSINNLIQWSRLGNQWKPINYGKVTSWGFDNSIKLLSIRGFSLLVNYNYIKKFDSNPSSSKYLFQVPFLPKHNIGSTFTYTTPIKLSISSHYQFNSLVYLADRETKFKSPTHLLDFTISYPIRHYIQIHLFFINVLNKNYENMKGYVNKGFTAKFQITGYIL